MPTVVERALTRQRRARHVPAGEARSTSTLIPGPWEAGIRTAAGTYVTPDSALRHGAVWACRDLIGRLVTMMPVTVYRDRPSGPEPLSPPPPLVRQPSPHPQLTFRHWARQVIDSALAYGNAYGIVQEWSSGWPSTIAVLPGHRVVPVETPQLGWGTRVDWRVDGATVELWESGGRFWHLPAFVSGSSPVGMSPVEAARQSIGLGFAAELHGARWFGDGGHPSALLVAPAGAVYNETQATSVKQAFVNATKGTREPALLYGGLDYKPIQTPAEESQFLETIKANVATVCMFYGVPPEAIGGTSGDTMTYATVEGRNLNLLTNTIGAWLVWLEDALTRMLPRPLYVRFNPGVLLKTSVKTQYQALTVAVAGGLLTQNEARGYLELQPMDGGDSLVAPGAASLHAGVSAGGGALGET